MNSNNVLDEVDGYKYKLSLNIERMNFEENHKSSYKILIFWWEVDWWASFCWVEDGGYLQALRHSSQGKEWEVWVLKKKVCIVMIISEGYMYNERSRVELRATVMNRGPNILNCFNICWYDNQVAQLIIYNP